MRKLLAGSIAAAALIWTMTASAADPTIDQIYQALRAGQNDQAQRMIEQVLRDHPDSEKAHFVAAEVYAREHKIALARSELAQAEQLKPGLPDFSARAVAELKAELGLGGAAGYARSAPAQAQPSFPWKTLVVLGLVVWVFWAMFRRRRSSYVQYPGGMAPPPAGYGPGYGPGGGYVGPGGGGIGSSIAGGLAGGLAAGAGIVAGEELAHHFLDGGQRAGSVVPPADAADWSDNQNADLGGQDFGASDPGSWDDGGGADFGGGGGGDDWT